MRPHIHLGAVIFIAMLAVALMLAVFGPVEREESKHRNTDATPGIEIAQTR